jgi:general secretion pathway protein B
MSYILEALKKAQAERQLGATPTIHAPTLHGVADQPASAGVKKPVVLALGAMGVVIVGLLALVWSKSQQTAPAAVSQAPAAIPKPAAAPAPLPVPAPRIAIVAAPVEPAPPVAKAAPAVAEHPAAPAVPAAASAAAPDDVTQTQRDLPEPIQRSIPQIAVGGYIYSKNPADRLLLIDKVLRHEGEEVAPGLVLEKLLPKSAVFNFKGYRYRLPY